MRHVRKPRTSIDHHTRSTSDKIDAIESELSAEFGTAQWLPSDAAITTRAEMPTLSHCLDEAALLFTNQQIEAARDLLLHACTLDDDDVHERQQAWWMLFELALEQNQPEWFDKLALDYANTFETSPPQWMPAPESRPVSGAALPTVNFRGRLTANSQPALQQLQQAGARHAQFCLAFGAISDVDLDGCTLLLRVLTYWQQHGCKVSIAGGDRLATALKLLIQSGRRDDNDAGWRLLIELMRLMDRYDDHESLCVEYCLTYEISPPTGPLADPEPIDPAGSTSESSAFLLPPRIMLPVDGLLQQIGHHAQNAEVVALDCHRLMRVDLSAAAPWLNGLHRIAGGKPVECRHLGFLVARLLTLVGGSKQLNIIHRKP